MQRRRFGRRSFARRRRHWLWIRDVSSALTAVSDPAFQTYDLLSPYRNAAGIDVNLPEFTIWRIRIKVSVNFRFVADHTVNSNDGVLISVYVDDKAVVDSRAISAPYDQRYMMWDSMLLAHEVQQGLNNGLPGFLAGTNTNITKVYDIKAHRRLDNLNSTLKLQVAPLSTGYDVNNSTIIYSVLCLLRN